MRIELGRIFMPRELEKSLKIKTDNFFKSWECKSWKTHSTPEQVS
jgi:hypothetical protein